MASTARSIRMPSSKVDRHAVLAEHAADQLPAFDDLEIVEAEAVAGRRHEAVVGRVVRRRQDGAETLLGRPVGGE